MRIDHDRIVVFDIETQKTFDEVGGYENREQLGVSYVGAYSYSQKKMYGFTEEQLPELEKILQVEQPVLIGFNSIHFDVPVLQPYFESLDLAALPQLDILKEIEAVLGHRLKLDSVSGATLHANKSGDGLDAIRWYREGDIESLAKYCIKDVAITRDVYEYGLRHGVLQYMTGGQKTSIPIDWAHPPTITEIVDDAFKHHKQLVIEYFFATVGQDAKRHKTIIEILQLDNDQMQVFNQTTSQPEQILVSDIWSAEPTGQSSTHQDSLF